MAEETKYKTYKQSVNGEDYYTIDPWAGNVPYGSTPISTEEYLAGKQQQITKDPNRWNPYFQQLASSEQKLFSGAGTGYQMVNGVPMRTQDLENEAKWEAAVAAGTMKKVKIGNGFAYAPIDSPIQSDGSIKQNSTSSNSITYQQLQNATLQDLQNNPNILRAFNKQFAQPNSPSFFANNFEQYKKNLLDSIKPSNQVMGMVDAFGNWNNASNPVDQQAALTKRQQALSYLNQEKQDWANFGVDITTAPMYQGVFSRLGGTGTTPSGGDTSQMDVANKKASVTTSTTEKPPTKIVNTLTSGSRGDDVKELQQWLINTGSAPATLKADSIYGPETILAVKQWQQNNGLQPDGIFGPKSLAKYTQMVTSPLPNNNGTVGAGGTGIGTGIGNNGTGKFSVTYNGKTYSASNQNEADMLQAVFDSLKAQNLAINPDLNLGADTIAKILEKAKQSVHPYYQQQIDTTIQDIRQKAPILEQTYNNKIAEETAQFQKDLGTNRENMAGAGLTFSGQRTAGEQGMQAAQNRNLQGLSSAYGSDLYNLGRTAEKQIGAANMSGFNLPSLANYSASLTGAGGISQTGTTQAYTPGGYQLGEIPQAETAAALALRNQNIEEASRRKTAGLSYQDLLA